MIQIQILSLHNDTICWKQQWKKRQITFFLSFQTSWDTNRTTPIQFQHSLLKIMYVITRNRNITAAKLVFIGPRLHAVSLRLLLGPWHSNDPEPKIHLFLLESQPHFVLSLVHENIPTFSTHHIPPTITRVNQRNRWRKTLLLTWSEWATRRDRDCREQKALKKRRVSQRRVCVVGQLDSDQALRLLCLKGQVRTRACFLPQSPVPLRVVSTTA